MKIASRVNPKRSEASFNISDTFHSKDIAISLIDSMINNYKIQHMSEWEGNHSMDTKPFNDKINKLKTMREDIISIPGDMTIDLKIEL